MHVLVSESHLELSHIRDVIAIYWTPRLLAFIVHLLLLVGTWKRFEQGRAYDPRQSLLLRTMRLVFPQSSDWRNGDEDEKLIL